MRFHFFDKLGIGVQRVLRREAARLAPPTPTLSLAEGSEGRGLEHAPAHSSHTTHAPHSARHSPLLLLLGDLRDDGLGGGEQGGDAGRVQQCSPHNLQRAPESVRRCRTLLMPSGIKSTVIQYFSSRSVQFHMSLKYPILTTIHTPAIT